MGLIGFQVSGGNAGSITVSSIMRANDVPNLPEGRIWIGDGNTIVSDTVYVDELNNRVGIGTTIPGEKLEVSGNILATGNLTINNTTTNAGIFMNSSSTGFGGNYIQARKSDGSEQWLLGSDSGSDNRITLNQANSADIKIKIAGSEVVTIKPSGDFGIGETNPAGKLHVVGNSFMNGSLYFGNTTVAPSIFNYSGNLHLYSLEGNDIELGGGIGSRQNDVRIGNGTLYVSGNVGIGADSPDAKLEITTLRESGIRLSSSDTTAAVNELLNGIDFYSPDSLNEGIKASIKVNYADVSANSYMTFSTGANTERMRIDEAGKVTISNTGAAHLILNGDSNNVGDTGQEDAIIDFLGDAGAYGYRLNTENYSQKTAFNFQENRNNTYTSRLYIDQDGDVGIGTNDPQDKLEVQGSIYATPIAYSSSQDAYALRMGANSSTAFDMGIKIKTTSGGSPYMSFKVPNNEDSIVLRSGNVGIGETNPQSLLHISDDTGLGFTMERTGGAPSTYTVENSGARINHNYVGGANGYRWQVEGNMRLELLESGSLYLNGSTAQKIGGGTWGFYSDERVKKDVSNYTKGLDEILSINPVTYKYNGKANIESEKEFVGIIAQEIKEVLPSTIEVTPAKLNDEDEFDTDLLTFDASELTFTLINAVKELKAEIEELKKQINE